MVNPAGRFQSGFVRPGQQQPFSFSAAIRSLCWLAGLLLLGTAIWLFATWNNDERRINRRLDGLRELIAKKQGEGTLTSLQRAQQATGFFTADAVVNLGDLAGAVEGGRAIAALIGQTRVLLTELEITIYDRKVNLAADRGSAQMELTASGKASGQGERIQEVREWRLGWRKVENQWLIQDVQPAESIRHPGGSGSQ